MNNSDNHTNRNANNISSPANQSLRQSLYVAALDRYLGIRGLVSPVRDTVNCLEYDFYHPESRQLIKIFKTLPKEHEPFTPNEDTVYIIDADGLEQVVCEECEELHTAILSQDVKDAALAFEALLYMDDCLWEYDEEDEVWTPMTTIERERCLAAIYNLDDE